ncbi:hypothetical protein ACEPPN_008455 [Leptodophora sp. 'Broadleaf-Isolate-01']
MGTKMDKLPYTPAELEGELARLKPLLGRLETNEQIKAACHERKLTEFDCATETLKNDAFWAYLRKISPPNARSSTRFGRKSLSTIGLGRHLKILWTLSAAKARLDAGRISGAELLQLFLKLEKVKYTITEWIAPAMLDLRCRLYKCVMHMESTRVQQQGHAALPASSSTNAPRQSSTDQPLHQTTPSDNNSALSQDITSINNHGQKRALLTGLESLAKGKIIAYISWQSTNHYSIDHRSNFGIPPTASTEDPSPKPNEDRYFTAMRKI